MVRFILEVTENKTFCVKKGSTSSISASENVIRAFEPIHKLLLIYKNLLVQSFIRGQTVDHRDAFMCKH